MGLFPKRDASRDKLATYLGVRTSIRFRSDEATPEQIGRRRFRLLVIAVVILLIGLWGVWSEFAGKGGEADAAPAVEEAEQ